MKTTVEVLKAKQTELIISQYKNDLQKFVDNRISDQSESEDILQEVYTEIYNSLRIFRDEEDLRNFVYSSARKAIISHYVDYAEIETMIKSIESAEVQTATNYETVLLPSRYSKAAA